MSVDIESGPPILFPPTGQPPVDAWNIVVAVPAPLVAWREARRQRGMPTGLPALGATAAVISIEKSFPRRPMERWRHEEAPVPHVHMFLADTDLDGQQLTRQEVQDAADEAWIVHIDRMVKYAHERPHLALQWLPDGTIAGIDHRNTPILHCTDFDWLDKPAVVASP